MSSILMDNLGLESATTVFTHLNLADTALAALDNLLSAMILWDDIYFENSPLAVYWSAHLIAGESSQIFTPVDIPEDINPLAQKYCTENLQDDYNDTIAKRAIEYYTASNAMGVNYLPAPERAAFLLAHSIVSAVPYPQFNRSSIVKQVDRKISEFYEELNSRLGSPCLKIGYPLLTDYVLEQSDSIRGIFIAANQIRNTSEAKRFRKSADKLEEAIEARDVISVDRMLNDIESCISGLIHATSKQDARMEVTLAVSPSISLPFKLPSLSHKKFHTAFLKKLVSFEMRKKKSGDTLKRLLNRPEMLNYYLFE